MKKTLLILSFISLASCKSVLEKNPYPMEEPLWAPVIKTEACIVDGVESVCISTKLSKCAQYQLLDLKPFTVRHIQDVPLTAGGPCDRMLGYSRGSSQNRIKNWLYIFPL